MRNFILGTDWWTDCDDAVAVRLLCRAHRRGEIRFLGAGINACMDKSVASLSAFMTAEGCAEIPVGIDRVATDYGGRPPYQARLAALPHTQEDATAEDAAELYIRLLRECAARGECAEIVEIGFMQVIAEVIRREPALFAETVSRVWMMAGKWDEDGGREHNFCKTERTRVPSAYFCEHCPVPVTYLGWEVGASVRVGGKLPEGDVLKQVLIDHGSAGGRSAWDPMTVFLALTGDAQKAGYRTVRGHASVEADTGKNHFVPDEGGRQEYVVKVMDDEWYRELLDKEIG